MTETVNILTMKWGDFYGPEYVNRLYAGVKRHLGIPFQFICFTDDSTGLRDEIRALPMPDVDVPGCDDLRWRKVAVFRKDLFGVTGPSLFLDLDVVVVGDLTPLFTLPGTFRVCRERGLFPKRIRNLRRFLFNRKRYRWSNAEGNTSVFRFEAGQCSAIFDNYVADAANIVKKFRREQEFVTLQARRLGILDFWPDGLFVSFQHACLPPAFISFFTRPRVPRDAAIVIFTADLTMEDALNGRGRRWYRPVGKTEWLHEAWLDEH